MARNVLEIPLIQLERALPNLTISNIKSLLMGIYEYKTGNFLTFDQILNVERRESKFWKELQRRGWLTNQEGKEFQKWLYTFKKRKVW